LIAPLLTEPALYIITKVERRKSEAGIQSALWILKSSQLCEPSKAGHIVFEGIRKDTACHDKLPLDNNFRRVMRAFGVHPSDPIRGKPGCKLTRCRNMRPKKIDRDSMLGIQRKPRAL